MELHDQPEHRGTAISQDISLDDLEIRLYRDIETSALRSELFDTLMTWLNGQIKQDIITKSERLLARFVRLLHVCNQAETELSVPTKVDEVFNEWLEKDSIQNPAYRRRYLIIQQDVHRLLSEETRGSQISGAFSLSSDRGRAKENHPPALSLRQKHNSTRVENEDTKLQHDTGYEMATSAAHRPKYSVKVEKVAIDKSERPGGFKHKREFSRQSDDSHSQDIDREDMAITREDITRDSGTKISRSSMRTSRRSRYICKRCDESGHMIQHCPTNLDPRYDRAPDQDYQCHFCGRHGNHYATLCPQNPHESSLTKQRERAEMRIRESRTPSRSGQRHDHDREISLTESRGRYRSHSPRRRTQTRYRSRSPERYHSRQRGASDYSPRTGNGAPFSDELGESPYKMRVRRPREAYMSKGGSEGSGRESPSMSGDDRFRFGRRNGSHSPLRRIRSPVLGSSRQRHGDLDKVTRSDEGRLAYDDESDALGEFRSSPCPSVTTVTRHTFSIGKEEVTRSALPCVMPISRNIDKTKDETEDFLCALAADIMMKGTYSHRSTGVDAGDAEMGIRCNLSRDTSMNDDDHSDVVTEAESPAIGTTSGPKHRLVQCPPFSPEVVSLFSAKETPIINVRSSRKTASQMMQKSEGCWIRHDGKATSVPLAADLKDGVRAINSFLHTQAGSEYAW
ncbi:hypothetical protein F4678DRAFT_480664 [Xylaria arbuscula]|nr:hypothetical protein F4678DRAFT_480664 [Xylaria arbuscula]